MYETCSLNAQSNWTMPYFDCPPPPLTYTPAGLNSHWTIKKYSWAHSAKEYLAECASSPLWSASSPHVVWLAEGHHSLCQPYHKWSLLMCSVIYWEFCAQTQFALTLKQTVPDHRWTVLGTTSSKWSRAQFGALTLHKWTGPKGWTMPWLVKTASVSAPFVGVTLMEHHVCITKPICIQYQWTH